MDDYLKLKKYLKMLKYKTIKEEEIKINKKIELILKRNPDLFFSLTEKKYDRNSKLFNDYDFTIEPLVEYVKFSHDYYKNTKNIKKLPKIYLDQNDFFHVANCMYRDFSPLFYDEYKLIEKRIIKNHTFIKNDSNYSRGLCKLNTEKDIICSYSENNQTLSSLITFIHETGHLLDVNIGGGWYNTNKIVFDELLSIFFELLIQYQLGKAYNNHNKLFNFENYDYYVCAKNAIFYSKYIKLHENCPYEGNKDTFEYLYNKFKTVNKNITQIINMDAKTNLMYSASYIYALELFNLYLLDKEKAAHILFNFARINIKDSMESKKYFENHEIHPMSNIKGLQRIIK